MKDFKLIEWIFKHGETAIYVNVANVEDFEQARVKTLLLQPTGSVTEAGLHARMVASRGEL